MAQGKPLGTARVRTGMCTQLVGAAVRTDLIGRRSGSDKRARLFLSIAAAKWVRSVSTLFSRVSIVGTLQKKRRSDGATKGGSDP